MEEPKINLNDQKWRSILVVCLPALILLVAVALSFFKGCTALGTEGEKTVYDPSECGEGFVTKANKVLSMLLQQVDTTCFAVSLDSLNARYRALEFALPYGEEDKAYIEASDIRLVAIHPEYIKDDDLRNFYFNSRLPQLLSQQSQHLGETFFSIRSRGMNLNEYGGFGRDGKRHGVRNDGRRPIVIESIKLIPSMFRVALEKNPWTGVIESCESCLFPDSSCVYLTYGNTMLPLHRDRRFANAGSENHTIHFQAIMNEGILLWKPDNRRTQSPIDYYSYYQKAFRYSDRSNAIRVGMHNGRADQERASVLLSFSHDTLMIVHETCGVSVIRKHEREDNVNQVKATDRPTRVPFEDGMKILLYEMSGNKFSAKLGEFSIYKNNPSVELSRLTQSVTGTSRFYISDYQTDLFTQQMLRGMARHLSNRENIDTVRLSIDPLLSREFENDIKEYVGLLPEITRIDAYGHSKPRSQKKEEYDMSVTIMDMATGEVLATPFYTTRFNKKNYLDELKLTTRNTSLIRRSIGSTFKPMEALASVLAVPSLLDLDTRNGCYSNLNWENKTVSFFGRNTTPWAEKSKTHWNGCDFPTFIGRSDDVYPVALVAFALSGREAARDAHVLPVAPGTDDSFFTMQDGRLRFQRSEQWQTLSDKSVQPFIKNISLLYNLTYDDQHSDASLERMSDINLFRNLTENFPDSLKNDKCFGLQEISPDQTQLRMSRFYDGEDFRALLVPWVLGQGDNMWNCVKIAEAWSRMVGKRDVQASFIHSPQNRNAESILSLNGGPNSFDGHSDLNAVWNSFLDNFALAQSYNGGTLERMYNRLREVEPRLMLFSKTGTPNAYIRYEFPMLGGNNRFMDVGMFTFSLVDRAEYENNIKRNRHCRGITCVVRVTRSYECESCRRKGGICANCEPYWGIDSGIARNFFSASSDRLRKLIDMTRNFLYEN